jgi:transcriptional regulator GlxA family with amidase domain
VCAVCTGAFLVAQAGLADGRRLTTHWRAASTLAQRFPKVIVTPEPIFVRDDFLWSSAGFTAGLDLALALIEQDLGPQIALELARDLIMYLKRPGDQSQLSVALALQVQGDVRFGKFHAWMSEHLSEDLTIERLASQVGMSPRTFARRYVETFGRTPWRTLELLRIEAAVRQLKETEACLKLIAAQTGFGSEQNLRRTFLRHTGMLPREYRQHKAVMPI